MKTTKLVGIKSRKRREAKKRQGICQTPHCRKMARRQRNFCNTCRSQKYDDPLKRMFWNLKCHAKARKIEFFLAWEWFREFAFSSSYINGHGVDGLALTIDRVDHRRGYIAENIQTLTRSENSSKGWYEQHGKPWLGGPRKMKIHFNGCVFAK